jgi:hypothetical protein
MVEEHKKAGLFERAEEFPAPLDSEFVVAESAIDFYKNGSSFLYRSLPFWMVTHVQRLIAVLLAAAAIVIPIFNFAPKLYQGFLQSRMRKLYRRLRVIENEMETHLTEDQMAALRSDSRTLCGWLEFYQCGTRICFLTSIGIFESTRSRLTKVNT